MTLYKIITLVIILLGFIIFLLGHNIPGRWQWYRKLRKGTWYLVTDRTDPFHRKFWVHGWNKVDKWWEVNDVENWG